MRRLAKRIIRGARSRIRRVAISSAHSILPHLSLRMGLQVVYPAQALRLPGQYTFLSHLISTATARQKYTPGSPLGVLKAMQELRPFFRADGMTLLMARTLFELGEFERAQAMLSTSSGKDAVEPYPPSAHLQALLE